MEEEALIFDDWAMYLMENWIEAYQEYDTIALARRQIRLKMDRAISVGLADWERREYFFLSEYILLFFEYDVPRHRHAYPSYISLTPSCFENLKTLRHMMFTPPTREHNILPTGYSGDDFHKAQRKFKKELVAIGQNYFSPNIIK